MSTLSEILIFIINTLVGFYISLVLIRFLLQWVRADYYNPVSKAIVKLTNPLVLPLRKIIPGFFGMDFASLVLAFILQVILLVLVWVIGGHGISSPLIYVLYAIIMLISNVFSIYFFAMLILVIASWVAPNNSSPALQLIQQLLNPLLAPIQRLIPPMAGFDFSPIVFLMVLHILRSYLLPALTKSFGLI